MTKEEVHNYWMSYYEKNRYRIGAKRKGMALDEYIEWTTARRERGRLTRERRKKFRERRQYDKEHPEEVKRREREYRRKYMHERNSKIRFYSSCDSGRQAKGKIVVKSSLENGKVVSIYYFGNTHECFRMFSHLVYEDGKNNTKFNHYYYEKEGKNWVYKHTPEAVVDGQTIAMVGKFENKKA